MDVLKLTPMSYVVVFGASLASFATGVLEPTIALYLLELGLTFDRIGQILSAAFLMVAITALPLALFASRIGITRVLFAGGVAATAAGAFLYLGEGADSVYFFFICLGFAQAAVAGPGAAILAENPGTKRIAAFALFSTSWMIPPALGALVSTIWFSTRPGEDAVTYASIFPVVFFVLGASGVIYLLLLVVTLQSGRGPQPETDGRVPVTNQARLLFSPVIVIPFLLLTLSTFMSGAGAGSTLPFLPPYLRSLNANAQEISLLVMINNIAMGVATQFTAPLVNRFGDMKVYVVTTLLSVATLLGIGLTSELTVASTLFILRGTFANMSAPIAQARLIGYVDNTVRATGAAWISTARWAGWSTFSPISGGYIEIFGYIFSFFFTSIIYVLSMFVFILAIRYPDLEQIRMAR